jgi:hypothetical protein
MAVRAAVPARARAAAVLASRPWGRLATVAAATGIFSAKVPT